MGRTVSSGERAATRKRDFANHVRAFVNRALPLRSERVLAACTLIAIAAATLAGAFGTFTMPPLRRLAFWAVLMVLQALLWGGWFRLLMGRWSDWRKIALAGTLVFLPLLPLEIEAVSALVGAPLNVHWPATFVHALAVAALIAAVVVPLAARRRTAEPPKGLLWREGFGGAQSLSMIRAEDHFCRLVGRDGRERLVYARFADLVAEAGDRDGLVVRRGCWIAADAVRGVERDGRKWAISVEGADPVVVPASQVSTLRAAGWI